MEIKQFSSLESTILSKINEGFNTFDLLSENVGFNEKTLLSLLEQLSSKNILDYNSSTKIYSYLSTNTGGIMILDGNIMLPTTVIKLKDKLLVSRGQWYQLPLDFDIRKIIWNVTLPSNKRSNLVELIQQSVLKEKKSKIIQVEEYKNLQNKLVPWSNNIKLKLNTIGEEITDVNIIFIDKIYLDINNPTEDYVEFMDFSVKSEILTSELLAELYKPAIDRKFENIKLNRIFNFSDFVFSNNSIPYLNDDESICYVKITGIQKKIELTYYRLDNNGKRSQLEIEEYAEIAEGIEKLKDTFSGYANNMLLSNDFLIEISE